jgi:O-acetyl-ADP-ribose deacetylase (regulator of RNase III)
MKYVKQDITTLSYGLIVHGVNCLGVMGSGVALAIRNKWPIVYEKYKEMPTGKDMLGQTHIIYVSGDFGEELYVANCYTQLNFGSKPIKYASLDAVEKCLESCFAFADLHNLPICSAKIASLRGGLSWENEVEPIFLKLNNVYSDVNVTIYYI